MCMRCLFCFKQKTAYEMRISDWSSDVCSSDLPFANRLPGAKQPAFGGGRVRTAHADGGDAIGDAELLRRAARKADQAVGDHRTTVVDADKDRPSGVERGHLDRKSTRLNSSH